MRRPRAVDRPVREQHAAELDLKSDKVKSFIALLKERGTVSDPTLATFEALYMAPANAVGPTYAGVVDRFPPTVRRGFVGGGLVYRRACLVAWRA